MTVLPYKHKDNIHFTRRHRNIHFAEAVSPWLPCQMDHVDYLWKYLQRFMIGNRNSHSTYLAQVKGDKTDFRQRGPLQAHVRWDAHGILTANMHIFAKQCLSLLWWLPKKKSVRWLIETEKRRVWGLQLEWTTALIQNTIMNVSMHTNWYGYARGLEEVLYKPLEVGFLQHAAQCLIPPHLSLCTS